MGLMGPLAVQGRGVWRGREEKAVLRTRSPLVRRLGPGALGEEKGARTRVPGGAREDLLGSARFLAGLLVRGCSLSPSLARASPPAPGSSFGWRGLVLFFPGGNGCPREEVW
ncbi:unnamed protein product, partial [Gulo gulo]